MSSDKDELDLEESDSESESTELVEKSSRAVLSRMSRSLLEGLGTRLIAVTEHIVWLQLICIENFQVSNLLIQFKFHQLSSIMQSAVSWIL